MIVPYMSIDLFFIGAPFLCRDRVELTTLSRRIVFVILVAGACFLLFPLRFAFERPGAEGWLGVVFDWLRKMDQPYNLLPSLHIALRTILAVLYARHTSGLVRMASHVWFSLIGISTLLTYQHHVLDVVGGFVLAAYCFYFVRELPARWPLVPNPGIGWYYGAAAALTAVAGVLMWPWGVLLFWPAVAFGLVAAAYVRLGPGIYRKSDGRLPLSTQVVLGPVLIGQWLSLGYYARQARRWDEVLPQLWIGRRLSDREAAEAVRDGVTAVLDLTAEFSEARPFLGVHYLNVPVLDLTAPTSDQLRQMVNFIAGERERGIVYVHCKIGYSRSAAAVGAFLLASGEAGSAADAMATLRRARPSIVFRQEVVQVLEQMARGTGDELKADGEIH
jgi:protein-tyrosine phosphatase/membrane-associated phospholipid phosphatase